MTWGSAKIEKLWLTTREIIFEVFQLMWERYLNVTDKQTQTDDLL